MVIAAAESTSLVAVTLPGTPHSVQMARIYVRTVLSHRDLGKYVEDVEMVTSELVSNVVTHTDARAFGLELLRLEDSRGVAVVVIDPCPHPPVVGNLTDDAEHGRGLYVVEALSAYWGSAPLDLGKAVFAVVAREG